MSFWGELKRRNVFKVAVAYVIVAWLIVQVANTFFPILNLPTWAVTFVAVLVILGFPLALLFAWAFELTPEGLKKTEHVPIEESITHLTGQKLNYILIGVIILGVCYVLFDNYYLDPRFIETELSTRVAELVPPVAEDGESLKSIVVLPFADFSPENDQEYFVNGLWEELSNCLAKITDLSVTSRTSAFSFKDKDKTAQEISSVLGVANILEGSVRKAGDKLRITVQLIRAADDRHLWSNTYDGELKDIFEVQEEIATAVAHELKIKLGVGESLKKLGGTDNQDAYELYLIALGGMQATLTGLETDALDALNRDIGLINAAIELDSQFALAWALKGTLHFTRQLGGPPERANRERDEAIFAAKRAIELEPNIPEGYCALGTLNSNMGKFIDAELSYRKAIQLTTVPSSVFLYSEVPMHYIRVGQIGKAHKIIEELRRTDPLNEIIRRDYILTLGLTGNVEDAVNISKRSNNISGNLMDDMTLFTLRLRSGIVLSHNDIPNTIRRILDKYELNLETPDKSLRVLREYYYNTDENNIDMLEFIIIGQLAAYFGDPEFSMDVLEKLISNENTAVFQVWYPAFHEVRQLPRFKKLVRDIGLVDYWNEFGWPDICRSLDDGDFVCD